MPLLISGVKSGAMAVLVSVSMPSSDQVGEMVEIVPSNEDDGRRLAHV